jgi:hypothetical protein
MRHVIAKTVVASAAALVILAAVVLATIPTVRHVASGWWNSPDSLAALPEMPQVHYQQDAIEYARTVAALLPQAIACVEAVQGRPFAHPVSVGVYASPAAFAAANGTGSIGAVGVAFLGRVLLSPALNEQRQRLPAILMHELSHAHIQGWISQVAAIGLPNWFKEGLAVMVSDGGGAEGVSEAQAREAIRRGERIAINTEGSWRNLTGIRFERPPANLNASRRGQMAYRQAGLFVRYLHDTNPRGFAHTMMAILDGHPLAESVTAAYGAEIQSLWLHFVQGMGHVTSVRTDQHDCAGRRQRSPETLLDPRLTRGRRFMNSISPLAI